MIVFSNKKFWKIGYAIEKNRIKPHQLDKLFWKLFLIKWIIEYLLQGWSLNYNHGWINKPFECNFGSNFANWHLSTINLNSYFFSLNSLNLWNIFLPFSVCLIASNMCTTMFRLRKLYMKISTKKVFFMEVNFFIYFLLIPQQN